MSLIFPISIAMLVLYFCGRKKTISFLLLTMLYQLGIVILII